MLREEELLPGVRCFAEINISMQISRPTSSSFPPFFFCCVDDLMNVFSRAASDEGNN